MSTNTSIPVDIRPIVGSNSAKATGVIGVAPEGPEVEFVRNNGTFTFKSKSSGTFTVTFSFADQATKITGQDTWTVKVQ